MKGWRLRRSKPAASERGLLMLSLSALMAGALSGLIAEACG